MIKSKKNVKWIGVVIGIVLASLLIVALLTGCGSDDSGEVANENNNTEVVTDADLNIDTSQISDKALFLPVNIEGTDLEVIAVKAPDDSIRTAFNTCQVCYTSGKGYYEQEGDVLICQNCSNQFTMDMVGVESGGCNPVPILDSNRQSDGTKITVSYDYLKEQKDLFANWKSSF